MASPLHRPALGSSRRDSKGTQQVLDALRDREVPVTAQGLFIELRATGRRVGLATVYRALHLLRDQDRVHEFPVDDGVGFLACTPRPHHHLVCTICGRVQEGRPADLSAWVAQVEQDGFTVTTCTIEVRGICSRCLAAPNTPPNMENDNSYR